MRARRTAFMVIVVLIVSHRVQAATHNHGGNVADKAKVVILDRSIDKLRGDIAALRHELAAIKTDITKAPAQEDKIPAGTPQRPAWYGTSPDRQNFESLADLMPTLSSLPPSMMQEIIPLSPEPSEDEVADARDYLVRTATPGYTMLRQTPEVSIGRLHPDFAVRLAEAVRRCRKRGLTALGVYSAYRPPAFGVGGFSDKFNSLHSYGLAVDVTGIGRPGSVTAGLWEECVHYAGLYLPYGSSNRAEFNHTQLIPAKVAPTPLRQTITASAPRDLTQMWMASGVSSHLPGAKHVPIAQADK